MRLSWIFSVALCVLLLFLSACSKEQSQDMNSPTPTNGIVGDVDEENDEPNRNNNEIEIAKCNTPKTDIDYIFSHLKPNMPRSEVVELFGKPCAETYTNLYTDYSIEWRYDFGQSSDYNFSSTDSYVDEQGLKSGEIAAQVFIGWNENDRVGDVISGLTVESVEPFISIQGAATIRFSGEIELSGTYRYYTKDEKAMEQFDLYILLDEQSTRSIPRGHHNVRPDLSFIRLGVINSNDFLDQVELVGKEGRFKGTFTNYMIQHALFKPTEDTIEAKEISLFSENELK